jgi:hypothetical protein
VHAGLFACHTPTVYALFDRLIAILVRGAGSEEAESVVAGQRRDWVSDAFGSTSGDLAGALFGDPAVSQFTVPTRFPQYWIEKGERLLMLPGVHRCYALVEFARRLGWLHAHEPNWSEDLIVPALLSDGDDHEAAFAGFNTNPRVFDDRLYRLLKPKLIEIASDSRRAYRRDTVALGGLFVGGWFTRDNTGARWLSDEEFRGVLIQSNSDLRTHVLWHIGRIDFAEKLEFLKKVWPLQLSVRTPEVIDRLCSLAFADGAHFSDLADAVLPLVSNADGSHVTMPFIHDTNETVTQNHSEKVLALLAAVLPNQVRRWPYGVDKTLERLLKAQPGLAKDVRFIRLKMLWDQR